MIRAALLLLATGFLLVGCRESITGPDPIGPSDPTGPTTPSNPTSYGSPLYVKGPAVIRLNETASYRAEPLHDSRLDHYAWSAVGSGYINAAPDDPEGYDRIIEALPLEEGTIELRVRAYDAEGNRIGQGSKMVTIER